MAQLYCTGPCALFVATSTLDPGASVGTPLFLGTAEGAPSIEVQAHYSPVMNDAAGQSLPIDYQFDGEEAVIVADLTRWNESVYAALVSRPNPQTGTRGTYTATDIGSLMSTEGLTFDTWISFPYVTKAAYSASMPAGYRFGCCIAMGPDSLTIGTRANKRRVIIKAFRYYKASDATMQLYDHDMTGIPAVPPTGSGGGVSS